MFLLVDVEEDRMPERMRESMPDKAPERMSEGRPGRLNAKNIARQNVETYTRIDKIGYHKRMSDGISCWESLEVSVLFVFTLFQPFYQSFELSPKIMLL